MKRYMVIVICLLVVSCLIPETRQLTDIALNVADFTVEGEPETISVTGLDRAIPELAPLFTEFGVDSVLVASFVRGNERYKAGVFQFSSTKGAMGAYLATGMTGSVGMDVGYRGRATGSNVQFVKGYYMLSVTPEDNSTLEVASMLASDIASQIEGGVIEPRLFETFPLENRKEGSAFYFMGPVAFAQRYSNDLAASLRIAEAVEGSAVTFILDGYPVEFMKITFPDRNATKMAMETYISYHRESPAIRNDQGLAYVSIIKSDRYEDYVAEMGDRLFVMIDARQDGEGQEQFEYLLRGGR